jgi:sugar/nucleoside kinase (ribokinase family)
MQATGLRADSDELETVLSAYGRDLPGLMDEFSIREWVVTDRGRGGRVFGPDGLWHAYPPAPAVPGGDPTGAGDVFLAAYTAARFAERLEVGPACAQAAAAAACHVAGGYIRRQALDIDPESAHPKEQRPIDMLHDPL